MSSVRCYQCGRKTDPGAPGCARCDAVLKAYCECRRLVSVFADRCDSCGAERIPLRYRYSFRGPKLLLLLLLLAGSIYGLCLFTFQDPGARQAKAYDRAVHAFTRGRYEVARERLALYHLTYGEEPYTLRLLADSLVEMGRLSEARELLTRLVEEDPANPRSRHALSRCLLKMDLLEEAERWARETVVQSPDFAPAHEILSAIARRRGDLETAIVEARLAATTHSSAGDAGYRLALLLLDAGLPAEALVRLTQEAQDGPHQADAVARICRVLTLDPPPDEGANLTAHLTLGEAAMREASRLEEHPTDANAIERAVRIAIALGDTALAIRQLATEEARRVLPPLSRSLLFGRAQALAGDLEAARATLASAQEELRRGEGTDRGALAAELAAAWLQARLPDRADAWLAADAARGIAAPVRLRLRLRASWWLFTKDALGSPGSAARILTILLTIRDLTRLRPLDWRAGRSRDLARTALARMDAVLLRVTALPASASRVPILPGREEEGVDFHLSRPIAPDGPDGQARQVVRLAARTGTGGRPGREIPGLVHSSPGALRSALMVLVGDVETALALAGEEEFARSSREDRCLAAQVLAAHDKPEMARELVKELEEAATEPRDQLHRGDLHRCLGQVREARAAYEAAAKDPGPIALAALLRLGELVVASASATPGDLDRILERIRALE